MSCFKSCCLVLYCAKKQKRRSSRVTKRQKYLEDVDLSDEDQQDASSAAPEVQDTSIVVKPVPFFVVSMHLEH